jgi:hypothetical protein
MIPAPQDRRSDSKLSFAHAVNFATTGAMSRLVQWADKEFKTAIANIPPEAVEATPLKALLTDNALIKSQNLIRKRDGTFEFRWPPALASQLHNGATFKDGTRTQPFPWTIPVIDKFPMMFAEFFAVEFNYYSPMIGKASVAVAQRVKP